MCLHFRGNRFGSMSLAMTNNVQWILTTALILSIASFSTSASVDLSKLHEHMTDDEFFSVFHTKNRSAVPDYEVVPVFHKEVHRTRRSLRPSPGKKLYVSMKNVKLYLELVDHVLIGADTPVYTTRGNNSSRLGIHYELVENPWPLNAAMYQDLVNNAALVMSTHLDGKRYFTGTIGSNTVIKPVPLRIRGLTNCAIYGDTQTVHLVYQNERPKYSEPYTSPRFPPLPEYSVRTVYPEILVIVDHETYLAHDKNVKSLCQYLAVFWNAVDLRFRAMKEPKVRLNIAGVIVPTDDGGAPYLTYHREGKHFLRATETFDAVGRYLYKEKRIGEDMYDLAVVMTSFNLCSTMDSGDCDASTAGLARMGGACMHDEFRVNRAVAVIEDHSNFDGILTAAHEVAHLLGVAHDGEKSSYGAGDAGCYDTDARIMSPVQQYSDYAFIWSHCSIYQMRYFLRTDGQCLHNEPWLHRPIPKMLPGMVMTREKQCSRMYGTSPCKPKLQPYEEDECGQLYCLHPRTHECRFKMLPLEGAPCDGDGICLDGKCLHGDGDENEVSKDWSKILARTSRSRVLIQTDD